MRSHPIRFTRAAGLLYALHAVALLGCSSGPGPRAPVGATYTPTAITCSTPAELAVSQLAYPLPNSSDVPTSTQTLIFTGTVEPILLVVVGAAPGGTPLPTAEPTALPSPLPSPIATPLDGQSYFAVSIPTLQPATTYQTQAQITVYQCLPATPTSFLKYFPSGKFSTQ
jgi:hypothetical protein